MQNLGDNWGAETSPSGYDLQYAAEADRIAPGIVAIAQSIATAGETLVNAISRARTTLNMTDAQRQMLDLQINRAQAGLAPLNSSQYGFGGGGSVAGISSTTLLFGLGLLGVFLIARR